MPYRLIICLLVSMCILGRTAHADEQPNMVLCENTRVSLGQSKQQVRTTLAVCCRLQIEQVKNNWMADTDQLLFQSKEGTNGCVGSLLFDATEKLVYASRIFTVYSTSPADDLEEYAEKIRASAEALPERTMGEIRGKLEARLKAQAQIAEMYRQAAVQGARKGTPSAQAFTQELFQAARIFLPEGEGSLKEYCVQEGDGQLRLAPDDKTSLLVANIRGRRLEVWLPRSDDGRSPHISVSIGFIGYLIK